MWVEASAPSNIAIIKYMGKADPSQNSPCNSSFSYTLDKLKTFVRIQPQLMAAADQWSPLKREGLRTLTLSENGQQKFLKHFQNLKMKFKISEFFKIESANNFPSDCGLASSASSFAALTQVLYNWALQNNRIKEMPLSELAELSKQGSGSSCRSFFSSWAVWTLQSVSSIEIPYSQLKHQVILCDEKVKTVSSSEAHRKVLSSDLFLGRPERAEKRLNSLIQALQAKNWKQAFEISWNEMWDMHTLFHTSKPAFMYMNPDSQAVLIILLNLWNQNQDGPLVTMDAGSNVHLLYRSDQLDIYNQLIGIFNADYALWTDEGYLAKR